MQPEVHVGLVPDQKRAAESYAQTSRPEVRHHEVANVETRELRQPQVYPTFSGGFFGHAVTTNVEAEKQLHRASQPRENGASVVEHQTESACLLQQTRVFQQTESADQRKDEEPRHYPTDQKSGAVDQGLQIQNLEKPSQPK